MSGQQHIGGTRGTMSSERVRTHSRSLSGDVREVIGPHCASAAEFVQRFGGTLAIDKILIANNGIAAVKCIRSIRKWAYEVFGKERIIKFVAMVTPEDMKANAQFIHMADFHVDVPGGTNNNNFANVDLIVDIAKRMQVQAVWAGWGHASENPRLPDTLKANGIAFMGPPAGAMHSLGDKISSSIVAQSASVPTMAWSGSGLTVDCAHLKGNALTVPADVYKAGCVTDAQQALASASRIGYPVMIKASEGGGGKGIRKVLNAEQMPMLFKQVQAEVPGSPIFIMKLASQVRHLEVQVLADQYGNTISLFGRDCSVQRRHQKIIEEGPVVVAQPDVFEDMEKSAVRLAKLVGYVSAGTVEYLYDAKEKTYAFLELNPRLQVEHPCTEMISGVNLPACQLQIAMGVPLHRIGDIRVLYGMDKFGTSEINFDNPAKKPKTVGHVIAARITAENPEEGFTPNGGTVRELNFRSSRDVWGYFSVSSSGGLHKYADSQFGHVFAWGEDREQARRHLGLALKELSIRGDFQTTVEYLVKLIENETFHNNEFNTDWLDALIAKRDVADRPQTMPALICGACQIGAAEISGRYTEYEDYLSRGQFLSVDVLRPSTTLNLIHDNIKYTVGVTRTGLQSYALTLNNSFLEVDMRTFADGTALVRYGKESHVTYLKDEIDRYWVTVEGKSAIFIKESDPTVVRSTSAGKLVRFLVEDGQFVEAKQMFAEIEVMKMILPLRTTMAGRIQLSQVPGSVLENGDTIARMIPENGAEIKRPDVYTGGWPSESKAEFHASSEQAPHRLFKQIFQHLENMLHGYTLPDPFFQPRVTSLLEAFYKVGSDWHVPFLEMRELLSTLSGRIPKKFEDDINEVLNAHEKTSFKGAKKFPAQKLENIADEHLAVAKGNIEICGMIKNSGIVELAKVYQDGARGRLITCLQDILTQFVQTERYFSSAHSYEGTMEFLLQKFSSDRENILRIVFSHRQIQRINFLVAKILDLLVNKNLVAGHTGLIKTLHEVAANNNPGTVKTAMAARQIVMNLNVPSFDTRRNKLERDLLVSIEAADPDRGYDSDKLAGIVATPNAVFDVIGEFFLHQRDVIRYSSMETYIRRAYIAYEIEEITTATCDSTERSAVRFVFELPYEAADETESRHDTSVPISRKFSSLNLQTQASFDSPASSECGDSSSGEAVRGEGRELVRTPSTHSFYELDRRIVSLASQHPSRLGVMTAFASLDELRTHFAWVLDQFGEVDQSNAEHPTNVLLVSITFDSKVVDVANDLGVVALLNDFVTQSRDQLYACQIRRLTFLVIVNKDFPKYFTYRQEHNYSEDSLYRHVDPALAFKLEMHRFSEYKVMHCTTSCAQIHLYYAVSKDSKNPVQDRRFFVRTILRASDLPEDDASEDCMLINGEQVMLNALDELEVLFNDKRYAGTDCNHIFINLVPSVHTTPKACAQRLHQMILRHGMRLWALRVLEAEIRASIRSDASAPPRVIRFVISNSSGYLLKIHIYEEVTDDNGKAYYRSDPSEKPGPLDGASVAHPYPTKGQNQVKRYNAQRTGSTYAYDLCEVFDEAVEHRWASLREANPALQIPAMNSTAVELVLDDRDNLVETRRAPGQNLVGMVAWKLTLFTPECPSGRDIVLIANDITHVIGSFGPTEDMLFYKASEYARERGIPRLYFAANSGARIGLADELASKFKIAWNNDAAPWQGFKYLYLTPEDFRLAGDSVNATLLEVNGESRYVISDVIGLNHGIGVENLRASGLIAGETSLAYEKTFTLSIVSCRSVGIGAYLVRLGQRTIQTEHSHIILTGSEALNKVLGRDVYTSNQQLGGTQIMYNNGVSHLKARDDFDAIRAAIHWLSYVPVRRGDVLPIMTLANLDARGHVYLPDPVDREPTFEPTAKAYDPRHMLAGRTHPDNPNIFLSGLFDRGSFTETLGGWGKTVVVGRARLGGIPIGVIAVETNSVEIVVPADPANKESHAQTLSQAGQVWFPDSAYKTAQAIADFDNEELPLFILANWRGFSGGMRDMYDEILKFGAMIVDNLRVYKQPVFVYLPPASELRGGAWVVVDPSINPQMMEMYADTTARGGVLEPEGTVQVRFRRKALEQVMSRADAQYKELSHEYQSKTTPATRKIELEASLNARYTQLAPIYHQVAVTFADLHDTPHRMKVKECISEIIPWSKSRKFFYWRLKRRLLVETLRKKVTQADPSLGFDQVTTKIERWFQEANGGPAYRWTDDKVVAEWIQGEMDGLAFKRNSTLRRFVKNLQRERQIELLKRALIEDPELGHHAITSILEVCSAQQLDVVQQLLDQHKRHTTEDSA